MFFRKSSQKNNFSKKTGGFALIYVLLLVALIIITVVSVGLSSLTSIKMARKAEESAQARQVALSGLEWGIKRWESYPPGTGVSYEEKFSINPNDTSDNFAQITISENRVKSVGNYKGSQMGFEVSCGSGQCDAVSKSGT